MEINTKYRNMQQSSNFLKQDYPASSEVLGKPEYMSSLLSGLLFVMEGVKECIRVACERGATKENRKMENPCQVIAEPKTEE